MTATVNTEAEGSAGCVGTRSCDSVCIAAGLGANEKTGVCRLVCDCIVAAVSRESSAAEVLEEGFRLWSRCSVAGVQMAGGNTEVVGTYSNEALDVGSYLKDELLES